MRLFTVESQSAGEGMTPPGAWTPVAEAETLDEAQRLAQEEAAKGWRYARVVAKTHEAECLRVEMEQLRVDLAFYKKLAADT